MQQQMTKKAYPGIVHARDSATTSSESFVYPHTQRKTLKLRASLWAQSHDLLF